MFVLEKREFIMEKKIYISPVAEIVEVGTLHILALSTEKDEQLYDEEQLSNEYRGGGDWDNIWGNM